ncbi:MAG: glyoxalase [candidate division Zixibacteria bacterium]|nr:glyoxalase [candidate division Zixibacteria bacterium]
MESIFILYVKDQQQARDFYREVLQIEPTLDVPGMTEFQLVNGASLGLLPTANIKKLLGDKMPDPSQAEGIPRAEVYLLVDSPLDYHTRALANGATELSPLMNRDWGHSVAYSLDREGHVLAFACATN